jgi:autotransporter-associated beta strand protein
VPFYTIHKILAGLLDAHRHCANPLALNMAIRMSDYHRWRVNQLTPAQVEAMCATYGGNSEEWGGMNEALTDLYLLSRTRGDANPQRHLDFARIFHRDWFINPLTSNQDALSGLHANTHIPQVTGFARCASVLNTNDSQRDRLYLAADNFWHLVVAKHSLVTGGNSYGERFHPAGEESGVNGSALSLDTAETCNTYNMLKLTAQLFARQADTAYADYYEHALYNHILASLAPDSGMMTYFLPMRSGHFKTYNKQEGSCWCCTGTGIENTARYNEAIYFHKNDTLWVNLYIPSQLDWSEKGLGVKMETTFPQSGDITLTTSCAAPVNATLRLRVPAWVNATPTVTINGVAQGVAPAAGSWIELNRTWANGDKVGLTLPMGLRVDRAQDDPKQVSLFYGPILLAADLGTEIIPGSDLANGPLDRSMLGLISAPALINGDAGNPASWMTPDGAPLHYTVTGAYGGQAERKTLAVRPFYDIHHTRYAVYFKMVAPSSVSNWTGGGSGPQWSDPANWKLPPAAECALAFSSPTGSSSTNNLAAGTLFQGVRFSTTAGTHLVGGNPFDLAGDLVQDSAAAQRIDAPINLRHGFVWRIDVNAGDLTLGGPLSGNGGFEKRGPGKLKLTGNGSSSGPVRVAAGILQIGDGGSSGGIGTSSLEVADAASVVFDRSGDFQLAANVSGAGQIVQRGPGTLNWLGVSTHSGATVVDAGLLRVGSTPVSGLAHRWSFNGSLLDSVGTAHASIVEVGANKATLRATALTLQGGSSSSSDYVQLGSGLLPKNGSPVTLELWATPHSIQTWSRVFDIGSATTQNLFLSWTWAYYPNRNRLEWRDTLTNTADDTFPTFTLGVESHIALVIEPGAGSSGGTRVTWYAAPTSASTLGIPRGSFETTNTLANLLDAHFWLGRSHYDDATANASYNEVRLWNTALPPAALEQSHRSGPNNLPAVMTGILSATSAITLSGNGRLDLAGTAQQVESLAGTASTGVQTGGGKLTVRGGGNANSTFAGSITGGGEIEIQGTLRLVGNASLATNLSLTNRGVLDIMTWNGSLPAGFVNAGSVLDRSKVKIDRVTRDAAGLRIGIHGYRGHRYQLQSKPNLTSGNWQNLGTSVVGSDAPLEFTAPSAAGSRTGFYRISVTP